METPDKDFKHELVTGAERFDPGGRHPLQAAPAQLAKMGVIAFLIDLEGYADSVQIPSAVAHGSKGRPKDSPAAPGLFFHAQTDSRLQSIMGLQSWNARRALDFLISLPDVDPSRIGVSGASGGGTQTFILGALDPRPAVFFPWSWSARGCRAAARARTPTIFELVRATSRSPR
jgi:cephalosporin-C deacetylase-like acetyl esterase